MSDIQELISRVVILDGNNIIGSVPDGWWRDRPEAARRLLARLACLSGKVDYRMVLVLDYPQPDLEPGCHHEVEVRYPLKPGKDGADRKIVQMVDEMATSGPVEVVTSDRWLVHQVKLRSAGVCGARTFLAELEDFGC